MRSFITHKRDLSLLTYSLGTSLKSLKCVKDLGIMVMVSSELSWSEPVNVTVNKANKLLGLVHGTAGSSNSGAFSTLYKTLLRPALEYAAPAWNPYVAKDVLPLKRIWRRASRLALEQWGLWRIVLPSNFFSSSNIPFIRLFLANTWGKKNRVSVLVSFQTA